ncbi:MAG TPA: YraN family protein [Rickettsiales bacterium]|nr:YraN family protein [Rickettsiales bacterium]
MTKKQRSYWFGIFAEYLTILIFFFNGYKFLNRRYKTKLGEIDLIFTKDKYLVVVEVKARKNKNVEISEVVSYKQYKRIINATKLFLNKNKKYSNFFIRIDVVLVYGIFKIEHLENVWSE